MTRSPAPRLDPRDTPPVTLRGVIQPPARPLPFSVAQWPAPAALAAHVERLWRVAWDLGDAPPHVQHTLPDPVVHVVFEGEDVSVQGPMSTRFRRELVGAGRVLGVRFRAAAFASVHPDLWSLRDQRRPADDLLPGIAQLAVRIARAPEPEQLEAVTAWLTPRLPEALAPRDAANRDLAERLATDRAVTSVAAVARELGTSERTLQRRLRTGVGWTPAEILRRRRIHDAMEALERGDPPLAELAYALGYCDQAHLCRDFRALVGVSPGRYARR
ncbi:MAG: helix-turn-helix transcriptional regulator [Myxococcota bacterium]